MAVTERGRWKTVTVPEHKLLPTFKEFETAQERNHIMKFINERWWHKGKIGKERPKNPSKYLTTRLASFSSYN